MESQKSPLNRILLITLVFLYVITLAAFSYANWTVDPEFMVWWKIILSNLVLSIPLILLYGSIYILVTGWREHAITGQINPRLAKIIHWAPRAAAILIIFFVSLFSLDVFELEASPLELLGGFLIANIPSIAMLVLLAFAWKRPVIGFFAFLVAAALFFLYTVRDIRSLPSMLLFVLPILLIASLFYADWQWLKPSSTISTRP